MKIRLSTKEAFTLCARLREEEEWLGNCNLNLTELAKHYSAKMELDLNPSHIKTCLNAAEVEFKTTGRGSNKNTKRLEGQVEILIQEVTFLCVMLMRENIGQNGEAKGIRDRVQECLKKENE